MIKPAMSCEAELETKLYLTVNGFTAPYPLPREVVVELVREALNAGNSVAFSETYQCFEK